MNDDLLCMGLGCLLPSALLGGGALLRVSALATQVKRQGEEIDELRRQLALLAPGLALGRIADRKSVV